MKELLLQKSKGWTYEDALKFHGGSEIFNDYIWEWSEDGAGVYLTRPQGSFYLDNRTGCVHRLHTRFNKNDFVTLTKLADFYHDDIRFDKPIEHEWYSEQDGTLWEYTVYRRPNKELGYPFMMNITAENIHDQLMKYINMTQSTIELFFELGLQYNFPIVGLTLVHLNTDSLGPFWMNLKTFEIGYDELYEKNLKEFRRDVSAFSKILKVELSSYISIAEKSWRLTT